MPVILFFAVLYFMTRGSLDAAGSQARTELGRAGSAIASHPQSRKLADRISQGRSEGHRSGWFWAWVGARGAQHAYRGARWTTSRAYRAAQGDTNPGPLTRIWEAGRAGAAHGRAQRGMGGYEPVAACAECGAVGLASLMVGRRCAACRAMVPDPRTTPPPSPAPAPTPAPSPAPAPAPTPAPTSWTPPPPVTVWPQECSACGAPAGEACRPGCPVLAVPPVGVPVAATPPAPAKPSWPASPALGPSCECCGGPSNRILCPACMRAGCQAKGDTDCQQPLPECPDEAELAGMGEEPDGSIPADRHMFTDREDLEGFATEHGIAADDIEEAARRAGVRLYRDQPTTDTTSASPAGEGTTPGEAGDMGIGNDMLTPDKEGKLGYRRDAQHPLIEGGNGMAAGRDQIIGGNGSSPIDSEGGGSLEGTHGVMGSAISHAKSTHDALESILADLEANHADPDVIAEVEAMMEAAEELESRAASAEKLLADRADNVAESIAGAGGSGHVADTGWHDAGD